MELGTPLKTPRCYARLERLWDHQRCLHVRGGAGIEPYAESERPDGPIAVLRVGASRVRLHATQEELTNARLVHYHRLQSVTCEELEIQHSS